MSARILVAEDYELNWMLVERMLAMRGHQADHASDGHEAVAMVARGGYALVFMDCRMPRLDGYAATREIRRRERTAAAGRVVIVAMSANASEADRRRCMDAGMDDYVSKPFGFDAIDEVLSRWLELEVDQPSELDPTRLAELRRALSEDELARMLRELVAEVSQEVAQLRDSAPEADRAAITAVAHRIQNSARLVGASRLAEAAAAVEARAERDHAASSYAAEAELLALSEQWELTEASIERELSGSPAFTPSAVGDQALM
jgi:two-component system, sensor histidine kinase and response regulator